MAAMQFDYVIVGAGSAGCALAEGLSRDGRRSVALIEAGGSDRSFWINTPLGYGKLFFDSTVNWKYVADPDPGLDGRSDYWPRGKVLGGSSSINAMVYVRGQAQDYDDWAAAGALGWSWNDVRPWFESNERDWLSLSDISARVHPLCRPFLAAVTSLGVPSNPELNGERQEGAGYFRLSINGFGGRVSAARAFLRPAMRRRNLTVLRRARATRILFEDRRAIGVEVLIGAEKRVIAAGAEVIVSAGAIGSPQLLQVSGVGPGDWLSERGVAPVAANPNVGEHLQDHLGFDYVYRSRTPTLNSVLRPWWSKALLGARYLMTGRGPLGLSVNQAGGFFRSSETRDRANLQLYFQTLTTLTAKVGERPLLQPDPFPAFKIGVASLRPKSRGRIRIHSADPLRHPSIQPNSYSAPEDLDEMVEGARFLRRLAAQHPLSGVIEAELEPGPDCRSEDEIRADIRARSATTYHASCTCRIAASADQGVVDPRLRVFGVDGLRVADASVFPSVVSGNTNAAAMMVGARAASLIAADHN